MTNVLILPGLNGSGRGHWQTWMQAQLGAQATRVEQDNWALPSLATWSQKASEYITNIPGKHLLVGHSFGSLTAVAAGFKHPDRIAAAILVAPANPQKFGVNTQLPRQQLPFRSIVVASTNDPWMSYDNAAEWASIWGSQLINLGPAGHINIESGFGPWLQGLSLVQALLARIQFEEEQTIRAQKRIYFAA